MFRKIVLLALGLSLSGCVSIYATATQPSPYIGTQISCMYLVETDPTQNFAWLPMGVDAVDLPLTLIMDTLLLPFTGAVALSH